MVDVALYEAVFSMMESLVPEYDVLGYVRERAGNALLHQLALRGRIEGASPQPPEKYLDLSYYDRALAGM